MSAEQFPEPEETAPWISPAGLASFRDELLARLEAEVADVEAELSSLEE